MKIIVHVRICILSLFLGLGMIGAQAQMLDTNKCHNWPRFAVNTVASMSVAFVSKTALKAMINEERPDHSDNKSFPSGHAAIAFAAARSIDKEFRKESIWIPIAGYAAATALGVERVVSDRHHWYDVAAGAALGYGAAELTWWLSDKYLGRNSKLSVTTTGQTLDVVYNF
jgi:membrane-associated phospholipid phosphatase